ncbi:MAG: SAV_6107 family HEPN domain-containing protein, partial [Streptosporangiaceae bacterium]
MNSGLSAPANPAPANPAHANANRPRARVAPSALALLESARHGLADAEDAPDAGGKYVAAHLAALRAAAAVVTARENPGQGRRRRGPRSVWE